LRQRREWSGKVAGKIANATQYLARISKLATVTFFYTLIRELMKRFSRRKKVTVANFTNFPP
jgi:hypothetical protein